MDRKILLKADNIQIKIDDKIILDNTTFDIKTWEIVSIIWENWVWKTTLLRAILWEIKINSWKLELNTDKISYVPQKLNIDKTLPITSQDFLKIFNNSLEKNYIKKISEKYNYEDLLEKKLSNLSWWEFQKILILNALISRPELVLMDEPTASIDETGQEKFYNILKNIVKENKNVSFVIVSHNREKVFTYSDKILHLHKSCSCINYPDKILDKDSELSHYNHIHDHKHID